MPILSGDSRLRTQVVAIAVLTIGFLGGCRRSDSLTVDQAVDPDGQQPAAIKEIMAADDILGRSRNLSPQSGSLSAAVRDYVAGIDRLDFSACPEEFSAAFRAHRDAWEESLFFFDQFPELRGEMHELFDTLRERNESREQLIAVEKAIWDTWAEVESAAKPFLNASSD